MAAIVTLHGNIPEGESREFPVAFSGKLMWRIPGISLDRKQSQSPVKEEPLPELIGLQWLSSRRAS